MAKELMFDEEARSKMFAGAEKLAKAVMSTLGPCGRLVAVEKEFGGPVLTKDGVTVAKEVELEDKFEKIGADVMRESSIKANDRVGDGTTTATVLAYAMTKQGMDTIKNKDISSMDIKLGIDAGVKRVCEELKKISKSVRSSEDVKNVATISANNDPEIGGIVSEAIEKVGKDGVITVEEGKTVDTVVKMSDGLEFDRGWINPYFVTDRAHMICEHENPIILVTDQKISTQQQIVPVLELASSAGKPIIIICDDIDGEALTILVMNNIRGTIRACAVKAPGFGDRKKEMLQDIAIMTGSTVITPDVDLSLEKVDAKYLGSAKKVKATKDYTVIIEGSGSKKDVDARVSEIKAQIEATTSDYEKEQLQKRLAKLSGGVAVISVGAVTETDCREKKFRVDDTLSATRAALDEGIVPGGGLSLIMAKRNIEKDMPEIDELLKPGFNIVLNALTEPMYQIAQNSGVEGHGIVSQAMTQKSGVGYDARRREWVNMLDNGIIDPTKVELEAIRDAGSIAGMLLSTNCLITIVPEKKECNCGCGGQM